MGPLDSCSVGSRVQTSLAVGRVEDLTVWCLWDMLGALDQVGAVNNKFRRTGTDGILKGEIRHDGHGAKEAPLS